jgi:hypothetical protein
MKPMIWSPGHRRAAPRQVDHDVVEALDVDARPRRVVRLVRGMRVTVVGSLFGVAAAAQFAVQALDDGDWAEICPLSMAMKSASRSSRFMAG